MRKDMFQRIFWVGILFGTSHVGSDNQDAAVSNNLFQRRHGCADAGIVCDVEVLVQGDVEVYTNKCLLTGKIEVVNSLHSVFVLCYDELMPKYAFASTKL